MSPEERQMLVDLFQRTNSASAQPRDRDAEAFIAEAVRQQPYAPYLLAQAVILQEQAMRTASERLQQLEAENESLRQRMSEAEQAQPPAQGGFLGGLGSLFGGAQAAPQRQSAPPPPPRPGGPWGAAPQPRQDAAWNAPPPPPPPQAGPWGAAPQQAAGGSSFLKGALGAAAGVAGGALLVNSLSGLFQGHGGGGGFGLGSGLGGQAGLGGQSGLGGPAGLGGGDTIVNNYYGDDGGRVQNASARDDDNDYDASGDDSDDDGSDSDDSYDV